MYKSWYKHIFEIHWYLLIYVSFYVCIVNVASADARLYYSIKVIVRQVGKYFIYFYDLTHLGLSETHFHSKGNNPLPLNNFFETSLILKSSAYDTHPGVSNPICLMLYTFLLFLLFNPFSLLYQYTININSLPYKNINKPYQIFLFNINNYKKTYKLCGTTADTRFCIKNDRIQINK